MAFGLLALVGAAIFAGVALYVNVVAQPARLSLDDRALLIEWKPSYRRGAAMQAPLALVGCLLGLIAWWQTSHPGFLIGAVAIFAPVPWTLVAIKPVNDTLMATEPDQAGSQTRALVLKMGCAACRSHRIGRTRNRGFFVGMYTALGTARGFAGACRLREIGPTP